MKLFEPSDPRDLVVVVEASLAEAKRLAERCETAGISAWIGGQECCSGGGCGPKAAVLVDRAHAPGVAALLRSDWLAAVERERPGASLDLAERAESEACPACGHAGPLVKGACGDCGLQLE